MANFGQLMLTNVGIQEQYKAQAGEPLKFKRIGLGSGKYSGNIASLTNLISENVSIDIAKGYMRSNAYMVEGFFSNEDLQTGFAWREIGLFVEDSEGNEILYCYANAGDTYDFIPATTDERYTKYIRIATAIGNATNVSIVENGSLVYVDMQTLKNELDGLSEIFLSLEGGELTGELIVNDNFYVKKNFDEVPYRSYIRPINYSVAGNGDYSTGLIHYKNGANQAQLMFNKDGIMLRDNVNGKAYHIFGQYNVELLKSLFLPLSGGIINGNLDFKKVENGSATIYKNHSSTADYGLIIRDVAPDGNYSQLVLSANDNTFKYRDKSGKVSNISRIQTGSYAGNGTAQKSLSFNFVPKVVFVIDATSSTNNAGKYDIFMYGATSGIGVSAAGVSQLQLTWNDNTLVWVSSNSSTFALNANGRTYNYIAIG